MSSSVLANLQNVLNQDEDDSDDEVDVVTKERRVIMESDDDDENPTLSIVMSSDDEDDDDDRKKSLTLDEAMKRDHRETISGNPVTTKRKPTQRRRRRSSARFLRLSGRFDGPEEDDEEESPAHDEHLGEMYRRAIRMNAENRINAGNSWGLNLIENIDKFLVDDDDEASSSPGTTPRATNTEEKRVNFTKASCTLDASVKIYSYRVDDIHLTSYKVLANLNRTDMDKSKKAKSTTDGNGETNSDMEDSGETRRRRVNTSSTETLESNLANINMNKLDSAFDIDPLFHKMSKTFDEGGAKGLLLVNLGVGNNGCGIVFDSKEVNEEGKEEDDDDAPPHWEEGMIDITSLTTKLESLLGDSTVESLTLVPQLESLRQEHAALEAEGFVDNHEPKSKSRCYAAAQEEEMEAEQSIHQEALERSRHSLGASRASIGMLGDSSDDKYASDDFGGGDDDGYDDDDFAFNDFVATDENGARYSSISFQGENVVAPPTNDGPSASNTTVLLDALLSGDALTQGGDYEYFNKGALEKITGGNMWAGSAHWKRSEKLGAQKKKTKSKPGKKRKSKKVQAKEQSFVDLSCVPSLDEILKKPTTKKSKRSTADPLLFPKATKTKHSNTDNLLPPDAGIGIEQLSKLFLRPNATVSTDDKQKKSVGFCDLEPFGSMGFGDGGDDDSYGEDNDGPGFEFADPSDGTYGAQDDFIVGELEGVRKVDKIRVGYATVAKKVDVKRLKRDLWNEIETAIVVPKEPVPKEPLEDEPGMEELTETDEIAPSYESNARCLSFKDTVKELESSQSQGDVTLPFYFICLLHLANEKGLVLDSTSLEDFKIYHDDGTTPLGSKPAIVAAPRGQRKIEQDKTTYVEMSDSESDDGDSQT